MATGWSHHPGKRHGIMQCREFQVNGPCSFGSQGRRMGAAPAAKPGAGRGTTSPSWRLSALSTRTGATQIRVRRSWVNPSNSAAIPPPCAPDRDLFTLPSARRDTTPQTAIFHGARYQVPVDFPTLAERFGFPLEVPAPIGQAVWGLTPLCSLKGSVRRSQHPPLTTAHLAVRCHDRPGEAPSVCRLAWAMEARRPSVTREGWRRQ